MGNFNRDSRGGGNRFGGGRDFGNRGGFGGGRDGVRPAMHSAVCSDCGQPCQVPFRPTGDRPVFCNNCFKKGGVPNGGGSDRKEFGDRGGDRAERGYDRDSSPRGGDRDFSPRVEKSSGQSSDQYRAQFEMLNTKLDKIMKMLGSSAPAEKAEKAAAPVEAMASVAEMDEAPVKEAKVRKPKKAVKK